MNPISSPHSATKSLWVAVGFWGLALAGSLPVFAQSARLRLSALDKLAARATKVTNVSLGPDDMQLAAEHVSGKQKRMVSRLKGIYVREYTFSKPNEYTRRDVESIVRQLHKKGWKAMVNVQDKKSGKTTDIYTMQEGGETVGMAIVVAKPEKLTVVNLVGPMNMADIGGMGGNFGIPPVALQHGAPRASPVPAASRN
jgi:hypothetical protein